MGNKKTSAIWKLFNRANINEKEVAICCLCKTEIPFKGNTTNLWFHLQRGDQLHKEEFSALESLKQPPTNRKRPNNSQPTRLLDGDEEENDDIELNSDSSTGSSSNESELNKKYII